MAADFILEGKEPVFDVKEISVLRYWKELVVSNSQINDLKISGMTSGRGLKL